jgi:hypothetical protein
MGIRKAGRDARRILSRRGLVSLRYSEPSANFLELPKAEVLRITLLRLSAKARRCP